MSRARPHMSKLTPEELEALALEHVESMFIELRATGEVAREQYHPVKLARRHPLGAAGLAAAAAAAFMLFRHRRRKSTGNSGEQAAAAAPRWFDSLLSEAAGAAGRALPGLVASWLMTRRSKPD